MEEKISEIRARVKEFQGALHRYLRDNNLEDANALLVGALFDLKVEMADLRLPYLAARFEILPEAPLEFFLENWKDPEICGRMIYLGESYLPFATITKYEGKLYLQIEGYTSDMERKLNRLREQPFLKPVARQYDRHALQDLSVSKEKLLQELLATK